MSLLELFCHVDDFCHDFLPHWEQQVRAHGQRVRHRTGRLALSEVMTMPPNGAGTTARGEIVTHTMGMEQGAGWRQPRRHRCAARSA